MTVLRDVQTTSCFTALDCMQTLGTCLCTAASLEDLESVESDLGSVTPLTAPSISQVIDVFLCSLTCCAIQLCLQHAVFKAPLRQRAAAYAYKTAGGPHSSGSGYVRLMTRDQGCTLFIYGETGRPAKDHLPRVVIHVK